MLVYGGGACDACRAKRRQDTDRRRGPPEDRGYGRAHRLRFRAHVLRRDPYCRCDLTDCAHHRGRCPLPSTDADHWPLGRRELVRRRLDPNDPRYGRGLCHSCHSRATARTPGQRGGWHARRQAKPSR